MALVDGCMQGLRELAPDMSVYSNEVRLNLPSLYSSSSSLSLTRAASDQGLAFEPGWQHQFWGDNYKRLFAIKREHDPDDVFWCHPCVGNDRWEERGYELCRVNK